jgi:hypothetical protein
MVPCFSGQQNHTVYQPLSQDISNERDVSPSTKNPSFLSTFQQEFRSPREIWEQLKGMRAEVEVLSGSIFYRGSREFLL